MIRRPSRRLLPDSKPPRFQRREGRRNTRRARQASIRGDPPYVSLLRTRHSKELLGLFLVHQSFKNHFHAALPNYAAGVQIGVLLMPASLASATEDRLTWTVLLRRVSTCGTPRMSSSHLQAPRPCRFCGTYTGCWSAALRSGFRDGLGEAALCRCAAGLRAAFVVVFWFGPPDHSGDV